MVEFHGGRPAVRMIVFASWDKMSGRCGVTAKLHVQPICPVPSPACPMASQNCESLRIFPCDRRTVGRHDRRSICSRFHALVPVSQASAAGTRACRLATSADRLVAATPSPPPASFRRPAPMGVPLPSVAAGRRRLGNRQTGDGGEMASKGLSDLLAVAITPSRTPQNQRRNPHPDPSHEPRQSALGCASHPRRTSQARCRGEPDYCRPAPPSAP
jgi:hypothetical protein